MARKNSLDQNQQDIDPARERALALQSQSAEGSSQEEIMEQKRERAKERIRELVLFYRNDRQLISAIINFKDAFGRENSSQEERDSMKRKLQQVLIKLHRRQLTANLVSNFKPS